MVSFNDGANFPRGRVGATPLLQLERASAPVGLAANARALQARCHDVGVSELLASYHAEDTEPNAPSTTADAPALPAQPS